MFLEYFWHFWHYGGLGISYPAPRALTANQIRVRKIKRKVKARKMLKSKKGKRQQYVYIINYDFMDLGDYSIMG